MADGPGARTRRAVDVRRDEIVGVTEEVAAEVGLAAVRVSDVAHRLGVSTGLIFYHFETRDRLIAETFAHAVRRDLATMDRSAARAAGPPDRVRAVLRHYGPTGSATGWRLWIDAWALAQHEPGIARVLGELDRQCRASLRTSIEEGVSDGSLRCEDPDATAARLLALVDGLSVAATVQRSVSRGDLRRWVESAVRAELGLV